jgi:hypothetical protein
MNRVRDLLWISARSVAGSCLGSVVVPETYFSLESLKIGTRIVYKQTKLFISKLVDKVKTVGDELKNNNIIPNTLIVP